jgi:hypothetical protein
MAKGISDYVEQKCALSLKQALWVTRGADYHGLARPPELQNLCVETESWLPQNHDEDMKLRQELQCSGQDVMLDSLLSIRAQLDRVIEKVGT